MNLLYCIKQWFGRKKEIDETKHIHPEMKYLIVGLGNVGIEYQGTRHNIGFDVVDHLAKQYDATWKSDTLAFVTEIKYRGRHITLIKPTTFMNRSGKALNYWMSKLKVNQKQVLVVVDDLHIDFGKLRLRAKGSDGGHNGLKDIQKVLGNNQYARLRIGIGNDFHSGQQVNYVLGHWTKEQKEALPEIIKKSGEACLSFASIGLRFAMEKFNR